VWKAIEASPEEYQASLGTAKSGTHGSVMALAKQLVVSGEATDVADGVGKVLAGDPSLYQRMLDDSSA
jgi:hypothetical protein